MIGKGRLDEVGMTAIMQAISAERETAILTLWHVEKGEGAVFFDRGVVVMAAVNELQEQAAFYELSHWEDAMFRLTPVDNLPAYVGDSATVLGMQASSSATPEQALMVAILGPQKTLLTSDEQREDLGFETELVGLLSRLESGKQAIGRWRNRRNPQVVLQILTRMLNDVVSSAESYLPEQIADLNRAVAMTRNMHVEAANLVVTDNQIDEQALIATYRRSDRATRATLAPALALSFLDLFETYFFELGNLFHGRFSAENWQETARLFCEELKRTLQQVRF
jgi:hypothetical protein